MLTLIALRNLARNKRRTVMALLLVCAGTAAMLLTAGFVRTSFDGLATAIISGGLGHLEVIPAESAGDDGTAIDRAGQPPRFSGWRDIQKEIEQRPGVRGAGAMIQLAGILSNGERSAAVMAIGVQTDRLEAMGMQTRIRAGANLPQRELGEGEEAALLGVGLARSIGAAPGDTVTLMAATESGSLNAIDLQVAGVMSTGLQDLDARILTMQVATALRLAASEKVTSLIVVLDDDARTTPMAAELSQAFAGRGQRLSILDWHTRAPFYRQVRGLYLGIFVFLGVIIGLLVALATANTILMSLVERTREFGTLLAIGTPRPQLALLVILEANWIGLLGSLLGCVAGLVAALAINAAHIKMPPPPAAADPIDLTLAVVPQDYLFAIAAMLAVLTVASLPPVIRLFKIRIVEALADV